MKWDLQKLSFFVTSLVLMVPAAKELTGVVKKIASLDIVVNVVKVILDAPGKSQADRVT